MKKVNLKSVKNGRGIGRLFDKLFSHIRSLETLQRPAQRGNGDYAQPLVMASYHLSMCRNILEHISRKRPGRPPKSSCSH